MAHKPWITAGYVTVCCSMRKLLWLHTRLDQTSHELNLWHLWVHLCMVGKESSKVVISNIKLMFTVVWGTYTLWMCWLIDQLIRLLGHTTSWIFWPVFFLSCSKDVLRMDRFTGNPLLADQSNFLHPVIYYWKDPPMPGMYMLGLVAIATGCFLFSEMS